jgi:hypothetical protein
MLDQESAIRRRAYEIWQAEGEIHGQDLAHWLRAQEEVSRARTDEARRRRPAAPRRPRKKA